LIGVLSIHLHLPGCGSLKEKRGRLKPLLARLHKEFNVSSAEVGMQDKWQESFIACAMLGNNAAFLQSALETVCKWAEAHWPDGDIVDTKIELL
jgi:uncharacterized protein YlxP (DUF503 family)